MKVAEIIAKVLAAIALIAGAIFLIVKYGDKIVAWAKKMLPCCNGEEEVIEEVTEEPVEEVVEAVEEPVEVAVEAASEETPVAEETDFEG